MDKIDKMTGLNFAEADELKAWFIGYNTNAGFYFLEAKGKMRQDGILPFFLTSEDFYKTPGFKLLVTPPISPQAPLNKDYDRKQSFSDWPIQYRTEVPIQTTSGTNQVPVQLLSPEEYYKKFIAPPTVNNEVMKNISMAFAVPGPAPGSTSPGAADFIHRSEILAMLLAAIIQDTLPNEKNRLLWSENIDKYGQAAYTGTYGTGPHPVMFPLNYPLDIQGDNHNPAGPPWAKYDSLWHHAGGWVDLTIANPGVYHNTWEGWWNYIGDSGLFFPYTQITHRILSFNWDPLPISPASRVPKIGIPPMSPQIMPQEKKLKYQKEYQEDFSPHPGPAINAQKYWDISAIADVTHNEIPTEIQEQDPPKSYGNQVTYNNMGAYGKPGNIKSRVNWWNTDSFRDTIKRFHYNVWGSSLCEYSKYNYEHKRGDPKTRYGGSYDKYTKKIQMSGGYKTFDAPGWEKKKKPYLVPKVGEGVRLDDAEPELHINRYSSAMFNIMMEITRDKVYKPAPPPGTLFYRKMKKLQNLYISNGTHMAYAQSILAFAWWARLPRIKIYMPSPYYFGAWNTLRQMVAAEAQNYATVYGASRSGPNMRTSMIKFVFQGKIGSEEFLEKEAQFREWIKKMVMEEAPDFSLWRVRYNWIEYYEEDKQTYSLLNFSVIDPDPAKKDEPTVGAASKLIDKYRKKYKDNDAPWQLRTFPRGDRRSPVEFSYTPTPSGNLGPQVEWVTSDEPPANDYAYNTEMVKDNGDTQFVKKYVDADVEIHVTPNNPNNDYRTLPFIKGWYTKKQVRDIFGNLLTDNTGKILEYYPLVCYDNAYNWPQFTYPYKVYRDKKLEETYKYKKDTSKDFMLFKAKENSKETYISDNAGTELLFYPVDKMFYQENQYTPNKKSDADGTIYADTPPLLGNFMFWCTPSKFIGDAGQRISWYFTPHLVNLNPEKVYAKQPIRSQASLLPSPQQENPRQVDEKSIRLNRTGGLTAEEIDADSSDAFSVVRADPFLLDENGQPMLFTFGERWFYQTTQALTGLNATCEQLMNTQLTAINFNYDQAATPENPTATPGNPPGNSYPSPGRPYFLGYKSIFIDRKNFFMGILNWNKDKKPKKITAGPSLGDSPKAWGFPDAVGKWVKVVNPPREYQYFKSAHHENITEVNGEKSTGWDDAQWPPTIYLNSWENIDNKKKAYSNERTGCDPDGKDFIVRGGFNAYQVYPAIASRLCGGYFWQAPQPALLEKSKLSSSTQPTSLVHAFYKGELAKLGAGKNYCLGCLSGWNFNNELVNYFEILVETGGDKVWVPLDLNDLYGFLGQQTDKKKLAKFANELAKVKEGRVLVQTRVNKDSGLPEIVQYVGDVEDIHKKEDYSTLHLRVSGFNPHTKQYEGGGYKYFHYGRIAAIANYRDWNSFLYRMIFQSEPGCGCDIDPREYPPLLV